MQFIRADFVVHRIHAQYYRSCLTIKLKDVHSENDEVITGLASIIKLKLTPGTIRVVRRSIRCLQQMDFGIFVEVRLWPLLGVPRVKVDQS